MKCLLCDKELPIKSIGRHLKYRHNMTSQDYFDMFMKTDGAGKCKCCGGNTKYRGGLRGYNIYCSCSCRAKTELLGHEVSQETRDKISNSNKTSDKAKIQHQQMSIDRCGKGNPMFGISPSQETRNKQSEIMKEKIASGEFTPCVTNSWANSRCKIKIDGFDKLYRSSWDAAFQILNPDCFYEKLRVPYISPKDNDWHNYIVDFIDDNNKIVYEIKPNGNKTNHIIQAKNIALHKWADENNYIATYISEEYFFENAKHIIFEDYDGKILKGMKQFL